MYSSPEPRPCSSNTYRSKPAKGGGPWHVHIRKPGPGIGDARCAQKGPPLAIVAHKIAKSQPAASLEQSSQSAAPPYYPPADRKALWSLIEDPRFLSPRFALAIAPLSFSCPTCHPYLVGTRIDEFAHQLFPFVALNWRHNAPQATLKLPSPSRYCVRDLRPIGLGISTQEPTEPSADRHQTTSSSSRS